MKLPILRAHAAMLPRLQAEENLRAVNTAAAGAGMMRKHDRDEYVRGLAREAGRARKAEPATQANLAAIGIRMKKVVKRDD